ncbi:hypothetical protein [uncultured Gammaproteobacteria bacterium]|jgi:hypothetical protein|nr:hypothetical protein [uncultured Gammaproteobacteria bacterium]CAC9653125.1 hypothetical protein [uncultured Gammaproteobacteria bacterium]CAC9657516.1 hypothetical protein [uncultured Gammaproteobacteria bacterium]VVH58969.1 hypothetical protein BSPCLSOX_2794 [uncultured Gammaproteobacteria bacterium]VVH62765.1 hypothetical protein BSPWISOX_114 [uncultured Gammaproteobacteria bacterium]
MSHKTYEKAMESYERYVRLSKIEVGVLSTLCLAVLLWQERLKTNVASLSLKSVNSIKGFTKIVF